jgi:hypothetical protein
MGSVLGKLAAAAAVVAAAFLGTGASAAESLTKAGCRVFLVPGAFGQGTSSLFLKPEDYFGEMAGFFRAHGCEVKKAEFPPDATIESRALVLKDQLARFAPGGGEHVYLVAHSQGALDARFALRTLGLPKIGALISIGAPHAGTPVAEWAVDHRTRQSVLYWLLRTVGGYDLKALSFAGEMTPDFLQKFLPRFERVPGVRYASAQGVCRTHCHWALRVLDWFVGDRVGVGQGDGIVAKDSQAWGDDLGEYDLDHISEVGADSPKRAERDRMMQRVWSYLNKDLP